MKKLIPFFILICAFCVHGQATFSGLIITDKADIKEKPNTDSKTLESRENGKSVFLLSKKHQKGWYQTYTSDLKPGWIHGNGFAFTEKDTTYAYTLPNGWSQLVKTKTNKDGAVYYYKSSQLRYKYGSYEGWIKVEPMFLSTYIKKEKLPSNFAYFLQYLRLDCDDKRISIESVLPYSAKDELIQSNKRFGFTFSEPIVPNSVGEGIWLKLCK